MSWDIVESINEQIPDEKDVVLWNLGDLFYGPLFSNQSLQYLQSLIKVMKGKNRTLNIVLGNHDKQFKKFAKWDKLAPLTKQSSMSAIFFHLGFTNVYEYPVLIRDNLIISHEPFFLKPGTPFYNLHGHLHQMKVDEGYFSIDMENYRMVKRAYEDSGRECPVPQKKKDWENWIVNPNQYINASWDCTKGKVLKLDQLLKSLK